MAVALSWGGGGGVQAHALAERVRGGGARGWNIDYGSSSRWVAPSTPAACCGGVGTGGLPAGGGGPGTLLGPEGTAGWLLSRGACPDRVAS